MGSELDNKIIHKFKKLDQVQQGAIAEFATVIQSGKDVKTALRALNRKLIENGRVPVSMLDAQAHSGEGEEPSEKDDLSNLDTWKGEDHAGQG